MTTISTTTTISLPAGKALVFAAGSGQGIATADAGGREARFNVGPQRVLIGPWATAVDVVVQVASGSIDYTVDTDGDLSDQAPGLAGAVTLDPTTGAMQIGGAAPTSAQRDSVRIGLGAEQMLKIAMLGKIPMTMTGIGNSIMTISKPWWTVCCDRSNGAIIQATNGHGVAGNNTSEMLVRKADVPAAVDFVVIMECTNDVIEGISRDLHIANMRGLIEFYIDRGQVPIICRPPLVASGQTNRDGIYKYGLIDFFLAQEYKIPFVDPWSQFIVEATGYIDAAAVDVDGIHPKPYAHELAGATMYAQLLAGGVAYPFPTANAVYGTYELIALPLMSSQWDQSLSGATASLEADAAIPGSWARLTSTGAGTSYLRKTIYNQVVSGDELFIVGRLKTSAAVGTVGFGAQAIPSNTQIGFTRYSTWNCDGVFITSGAVAVGNDDVQCFLFLQNGEVGKTAEIAQVQIYNKTLLMTR